MAVALHRLSFVMRTYSQYYHGLDKDSKRRYDDKLNLIRQNVDDPYTIPLSTQSSNHSEKWPDVEYPDIYNYLVNTRSPYTKDMLEGYKYFTAGWVSNATLQELPSSVPVKVILSQPIDSSDNFERESWCFCGGEENGEMIACDCDSCSIVCRVPY